MPLLDVTVGRRRDLALASSNFQRTRGEGRPGYSFLSLQGLCAYGESPLVFPSFTKDQLDWDPEKLYRFMCLHNIFAHVIVNVLLQLVTFIIVFYAQRVMLCI